MAKRRQPVGNEDHNVFRCKRCRFTCDLVRDKRGPGSGLQYDQVGRSVQWQGEAVTFGGESVSWQGDWSRDIYDPYVVSGCPFCGTKNYDNWQQ